LSQIEIEATEKEKEEWDRTEFEINAAAYVFCNLVMVYKTCNNNIVRIRLHGL
jgi:hypothetical protein